MCMIMSICVGYIYYADIYLLGTHVLSKLVDGCQDYILFVAMFYGKNKNKNKQTNKQSLLVVFAFYHCQHNCAGFEQWHLSSTMLL